MFVDVGEVYNIELQVTDENNTSIIDDSVVVTIQDKCSNLFFNGIKWVEDKSELIAKHTVNGIYSLAFHVDTKSLFEIKIQSSKYPISKIETIQSYKKNADGTPVVINNNNFSSQDGSDSIVRDTKNMPLAGVQITCYNNETKEVISSTQTDILGEWSMIIPSGTYIFMFEKDGYMSVAFERTVL